MCVQRTILQVRPVSGLRVRQVHLYSILTCSNLKRDVIGVFRGYGQQLYLNVYAYFASGERTHDHTATVLTKGKSHHTLGWSSNSLAAWLSGLPSSLSGTPHTTKLQASSLHWHRLGAGYNALNRCVFIFAFAVDVTWCSPTLSVDDRELPRWHKPICVTHPKSWHDSLPKWRLYSGIVGQACIHVSLYLFLDSKICLSIRVGNNGPVTAIAVAGGNNPGGLHAWILQPV